MKKIIIFIFAIGGLALGITFGAGANEIIQGSASAKSLMFTIILPAISMGCGGMLGLLVGDYLYPQSL